MNAACVAINNYSDSLHFACAYFLCIENPKCVNFFNIVLLSDLILFLETC